MIRPLVPEDVPQVWAIESVVHTNPWSQESLRHEIVTHSGLGYFSNNDLTCYCLYYVVLDEAHLLNIATHLSHRRRGYARVVLQTMIANTRESGCLNIFLEVRESNRSAQQLYLSCGFKSCGVRKCYYRDTMEGALLMKREL